MKIHELKIDPKYYKEVLAGFKKVELRFNDRNFRMGDILYLNEFNPTTKRYTGGQVRRKITQVYKDLPGLKENYVLLQMEKLDIKTTQ